MHAQVIRFKLNPWSTEAGEIQTHLDTTVLPELRNRIGYEGSYFLDEPSGVSILICLWENEECALASERVKSLANEIARLLGTPEETLTESTYDVPLADHPA